MSRRQTLSLLIFLVALFLVGTEMPNAWKSGIERRVGAPFSLASWAHLVMFAFMAMLAAIRPLAWPVGRILLLAFVLALLTEGLQFFAIGRHPRLTDVGIDVAGALIGIALAARFEKRRKTA